MCVQRTEDTGLYLSEPMRLKMRVGWEHVMVCVGAHLQGLGGIRACLREKDKNDRDLRVGKRGNILGEKRYGKLAEARPKSTVSVTGI